ncbi:ATP-dependent helicase [Bacteroides sp. 214]|uniref:DEAD/DEAH box helicase n=1 Tax=Bacteroides sp. 214 TaxID=2302935 RepID=UPI0013CF80E6|nr:DEAD/DEAH box helicase [Bacteroides sp. 214]NDW12762.1 ATP-dependent helicase [Bacteroides sp. 214]
MREINETIRLVLQKLGISALNEMQLAALNSQLVKKDIILLSPTGSGKTLAFLLPLLLRLQTNVLSAQALVLAPSRELALQIDAVFKSMGTPWKSCCCYGGHPIAEEKKNLLNNHPTLIIGTPGRVADHLRKGNIAPETIHTLIIDEFDKSLELGFEEEMEEIISQLSQLKKRVLLSATAMETVPTFTGLVLPEELNFLSTRDDEKRLELVKLLSPDKDKIETLYRLLCTLGNRSSIVFCNHRESVERVYKLLREKNICCEMFHGGMEQRDREKALYKYRNGSCYALISTDLAARGLDIPEVEHIVHYHIPVNEEAFTHRNGRTARWKATGTSYIILNPEEQLPPYIPTDISTYLLPASIPNPSTPLWVTLYISRGKRDKLNKVDIVGFFYKIGKLSREDLGLVEIRENYAFVSIPRTKLKQTLSLVRGEKVKGIKVLIEEAR